MAAGRRALVVGVACVGIGAGIIWGSPVAAGAGRAGAAQDAAPVRTVWDGVYTEEQARRGETQYMRRCETCHGADLSGNPVQEVPALVFDAFLAQWNDRTLQDLFDAMKRSMPRDDPGSLNARAYVDVMAYVLQANRMPSGPKDLSLSPAALAQIAITRKGKS
jgi:cytochrome c5